jgi:hypothetical protein
VLPNALVCNRPRSDPGIPKRLPGSCLRAVSLHDPARLAGEPDGLAAVREAGTARTQMEAHTVNLARILVTFVTLVTQGNRVKKSVTKA